MITMYECTISLKLGLFLSEVSYSWDQEDDDDVDYDHSYQEITSRSAKSPERCRE